MKTTFFAIFLCMGLLLFLVSCSSAVQNTRYTASDLDSIPLSEIAEAPENFFVGESEKAIYDFNKLKAKESEEFKADKEALLSSQENSNKESSKESLVATSKEPSQLVDAQRMDSKEKITSEIDRINLARTYIGKTQYLEALEVLKELYGSQVPQVKARAKFMTGEVLFLQGEYDLSMQIYEELAQYHADSFIAVEVLSKLILCAKKLGLDDKVVSYTKTLSPFLAEAESI